VGAGVAEGPARAPALDDSQACKAAAGPLSQLVEAVAQRNRGVRNSQSRHEPILNDVLYGSLGHSTASLD
jgi:hypothetical protein